MKLSMTAEYNKTEIEQIVKEYHLKSNPTPVGYHLESELHYTDSVRLTLVSDKEE